MIWEDTINKKTFYLKNVKSLEIRCLHITSKSKGENITYKIEFIFQLTYLQCVSSFYIVFKDIPEDVKKNVNEAINEWLNSCCKTAQVILTDLLFVRKKEEIISFATISSFMLDIKAWHNTFINGVYNKTLIVNGKKGGKVIEQKNNTLIIQMYEPTALTETERQEFEAITQTKVIERTENDDQILESLISIIKEATENRETDKNLPFKEVGVNSEIEWKPSTFVYNKDLFFKYAEARLDTVFSDNISDKEVRLLGSNNWTGIKCYFDGIITSSLEVDPNIPSLTSILDPKLGTPYNWEASTFNYERASSMYQARFTVIYTFLVDDATIEWNHVKFPIYSSNTSFISRFPITKVRFN